MADSDEEVFEDPFGVVVVPIDGILDLHNYSPREVGEVVPAYLESCVEKGIHEVRIIHGKGRGVLRRSVHALLQRSALVDSFAPGDLTSGQWGATIVALRRESTEQ